MNKTVYFVVELEIHEGKLDAFESVAQAMIAGTLKEPGALGYEWYFSADRKRCRLIETYKDEEAALAHVSGSVVLQLVPKLITVSSIRRFEVYGDPGPRAAAALAVAGAEIFEFRHGLGR